MSNEVIIKHKHQGQTLAFKATSVTGETKNGTFYWEFARFGCPVASVAERNLLPGYDEKTKLLYGKPWLDKVQALKEVHLHREDMSDYENLPEDTVAVWTINHLALTWIIEQEAGATLHIFNNPTKTIKAKTFHAALKKLFPKQPVVIHRLKVVKERVQ